MTGEHIRGIPRTYEKEITLADTPYTLSLGYNCVKVDTTGGNVRVNLPNVNYPIDVIKTSSDSYIVTVWVGGVQKATVAGELSKITIENAEVTQDEPWYPYDAIVGIAGVSGDGGEVLAKDRYGRVIAGGRGVAGTDDYDVISTAYTNSPIGGHLHFASGTFVLSSPLHILKHFHISGNEKNSSILKSSVSNTDAILRLGPTDPTEYPIEFELNNIQILSEISGGYPVTDYGVDVSNIVRSSVDNCKFRYAKKYCIWFRYNYGLHMRNSLVMDAIVNGGGVSLPLSVAGIKIGDNTRSTDYMYGGELTLDGCDITQCMGAGIFAERASELSVKNTAVQGNYHHGIVLGVLGAGLAQIVICDNVHFESNNINNLSNIYDIYSVYGRYITISNCKFGASGTGSRKVKAGYGNLYSTIVQINNCSGLTLFDEGVDMWSRELRINSFGYSKYGSSTGTGSEQTIAHGLAAIPTGCKAWIKYLVGARYITEMIPFDATNVYPTVDNGVAYEWRIE